MSPNERQVYLNGEFVPQSQACVSIFDSALVFGDMAFEMTRSFNHQPFLLERHLDRLYASLKLIEIDCGLTQDEMHAVTLQTIERNIPLLDKRMDFYIMHDVSRGPLPMYRELFGELRPTVAVSVWPLASKLGPLAKYFDTGLTAVIPSQRAIPFCYIDPKAKTRSRLHYQIANLQAERMEPGAWAVLLDEHGCIAEGTGSNFFIVKDGCLYTSRGRNILRGVSRGFVFDLAKGLGIPCEELDIDPYDVFCADEAFFTATSYGVMPVSRFEGRTVGDGRPGPVAGRLLAAWSEAVGVDIVAQARWMASLKEAQAPGQ